MYERAGFFYKLHAASRRLVVRYFVVAEEQVWVVKELAVMRQALEAAADVSEVLLHISQAKSMPLADLVVGPKQHVWFRVLHKRTRQVFSVFPWKPQTLDELYCYFSKREFSMATVEERTEDISTITLPNGNVYCGELDSSGRPHSDAGREFREDGSVYFGSFRGGVWHGAGVVLSANLDLEYVEYYDGRLTGLCVFK